MHPVSELALANESVGGCVIAILAEKEKADMEAPGDGGSRKGIHTSLRLSAPSHHVFSQ